MKKTFPFSLPVFSLILVLLLHASPEIPARIIYVGPGEEYGSIMYGLAQAQDGDTVMVRDGVYVEEIKVRRGLVLMAENRHQAVIGDSTDTRALIAIRQAAVNGAVIDGFRFAPGDYPGILVGDTNADNSPRNCVIRNNLIEGRSVGINVTLNSSNTAIEGNTLSGIKGIGIAVGGAGDHVISDNIVENCEVLGIGLAERDDVDTIGNTLVSGNTIRNNQGGGLNIERPRVRVEKNLVEGNLMGIGTNSGKTDIVIADSNQVVGNAEGGIFIADGCEAVIEGNVISFNGREGVMNHGSVRIEANVMEGNDLGIFNASGSVHIEDNDILSSNSHGVEISPESLGATIHNNRISANTACGIYTSQAALITGNSIEENGDQGIMLLQGARDVEIKDQNLIARNLGWEIGLEAGTEALISNNILEDDTARLDERHGHSGIYILGSARITGNVIRKMNSVGIYIDEGAGDVVVTGRNTIEQNQYGILAGSTATIKDNTISDNQVYGIWIYDPPELMEVSWNIIEGNNVGLRCDSVKNGLSILWNSIRGNSIGLGANGEMQCRNNTVRENEQAGIWIEQGGIDLGSTAVAEGGMAVDSGLNAILENGEWNIRNDSEDTIRAAYNYWGLSDADSIDASIRDDEEDPSTGPVLFEPFLGDLNVGRNEKRALGEQGSLALAIYPNPSRGAVNIVFTLDQPGPVYLILYDQSGRQSWNLIQGEHYPAGTHRIPWMGEGRDGSVNPGGMYLVLLRSGGEVREQKIFLLK